MKLSPQEEELWRIVQALNRAWTKEGNANALENYFHREMVAITASDRSRLDGREACISSWKAFAESAKIHRWNEFDPKVQIYGDGKFAVVTYYFDMSFDMGRQTINMGGRDMFVFVKEAEKWWVVADQFSSYPAG